jgi:hypothetical protein
MSMIYLEVSYSSMLSIKKALVYHLSQQSFHVNHCPVVLLYFSSIEFSFVNNSIHLTKLNPKKYDII